jgi:hypothetical protein
MYNFAFRPFSTISLAGLLALHALACGDDTTTPGTGGSGGGASASTSGSTASGPGSSSTSGTTTSGSSSTSEGAGAGGYGGQGGAGQGGDAQGGGGAGGASTAGAEAVARCEAFNDLMNDLEIELGCDEDETYYFCEPMANDVEQNDCLDDVVAYFDCSTQLIEANVEACACNDANDEVRCDLEDEFELECSDENDAFVACVGGPKS